MAHPQQLKFVELFSRHFQLAHRHLAILEVGSYDVNGSVRSFFPESRYVGVDLTSGPGVDVVVDGGEADFPSDSFDLAISCECFEHNPKWMKTFGNMQRMTKPGGLVIVSCASRGRLEHGTTRTTPLNSPGTQKLEWDYYRNLNQSDFVRHFPLRQLFDEHIFCYNGTSRDLYFVGIKSTQGAASPHAWSESALQGLFAAIDRETRETGSPPLLRYGWKLLLLPLWVTSYLPDRWFQNVAIPYSKLLRKMSHAVRKLL